MNDDPLDDWTEEDEAAFQLWLEDHPEEAAAYAAAARRAALPTVEVQLYRRPPLLSLLMQEDKDAV